MLKQPSLICSAALLLAVAACSSDSTGVSANIITQADANQLAGDMDAVSTLGTTDFGLGASFNVSVDGSGASAAQATSAPFPINTQFTVTKQCPKGGQVAIAGSIVAGVLSGLQTQTHKGSFTWARTGGSGTCDVDLASSYDPATHTVTVTGTFCGHTVNVTRTRAS